MASWELFDKQPDDYRNTVLPPKVTTRVAIETGVPQGWHRYVGEGGLVVAMNRFGASAPYKTLFEKLGFTADHVVEKVLELMAKA
jgi:transketolase